MMKLGINTNKKFIAKFLQEYQIYLSGSYALFYQGINLMRDASDVDFVTLKHLSDSELSSIIEFFNELGYSANIDNKFNSGYYYTDNFICNVYSSDIIVDIRKTDELNLVMVDGIKLHSYKDILNKKLEYAKLPEKYSKKHKKDLSTLGICVESLLEAQIQKEHADETYRRELNHLNLKYNDLMNNTHDFIYQIVFTYQQPYRDRLYQFFIKSHYAVDKVLAIAYKRIPALSYYKNGVLVPVENKGKYFTGSCNFPFGLEPYYKLTKKDKIYILDICYPYTD